MRICVCVCVMMRWYWWGILCCVVIYCIRVPDFTNVIRHTMAPIPCHPTPPPPPSCICKVSNILPWKCVTVCVCICVAYKEGVCISVWVCVEELSHKYSVRSHISFFRFVCAPLLQSGVDIRVGIIWLPFSPFRFRFASFRLQFHCQLSAWA